MELEVESASVADRLSRVVPPPQSRRVGAVIMYVPVKRDNCSLTEFKPAVGAIHAGSSVASGSWSSPRLGP